MLLKAFISLFVSLIGCTVQVIDISQRYFRYSTKTNVEIQIVTKLEPQAVSICWVITEILQPDMILSRFGIDITSYGKIDKKKMYQLLENMTISDIHDMTPPNISLLAEKPSCAFKYPNKLIWKYPWNQKKECHKLITISKFLHRFLMCYKIAPKDDREKLDYEDVSFTPSYPGLMRIYFLNASLVQNYTLYSVYVHSHDSSDLYDSVFSMENAIDFNSTPIINVVSTPISQIRLPPPYDTMCRNIEGFHSVGEYLFDQLNQISMKEMKYVHTMEHVYERYQYPIINPKTIRIQSFHDQFMRFKIKIFSQKFLDCHLKYNVPQTMREEGDRISIMLNWPQDAGTAVSVVPYQESIDFLVYILSSVGIWLGLSIFSVTSTIEKAIVIRLKKKSIEKHEKPTRKNSEIKRYLVQTYIITLRAKVNRVENEISKLKHVMKNIIKKINED